MKILISGASGLVGSHLVDCLTSKGHTIVHLVRKPALGHVLWDPVLGEIDKRSLEGFDGVIHLAGENLAAGKWTADRKRSILESRVRSTRFLADTLASLKNPPKFLFSASAVGYYGSSDGSQLLDETSPSGIGFLADVCRAWEAASSSAQQAGIRVVHLRFGPVLAAKGGMLPRLLPIFRSGMGGIVGDGKQVMSWVALPEIGSIVSFLIDHPNISGAVNCVAPYPVMNREFSQGLAKALSRPCVVPVPALMIRLLFGEMGEEMILKGSRVVPKVLQNAGYAFLYPQLGQALEKVLK